MMLFFVGTIKSFFCRHQLKKKIVLTCCGCKLLAYCDCYFSCEYNYLYLEIYSMWVDTFWWCHPCYKSTQIIFQISWWLQALSSLSNNYIFYIGKLYEIIKSRIFLIIKISENSNSSEGKTPLEKLSKQLAILKYNKLAAVLLAS